MVSTETTITNEQQILRKCSCGWSKVTTHRDLRIHQGKAKCGGTIQMQSSSASAGQTSRKPSLVEHHSAADSNIADGQEEEEHLSLQQTHRQQLVPTPQNKHHEEVPGSEPTMQARGERPIRRPKVKWPKASDKEERIFLLLSHVVILTRRLTPSPSHQLWSPTVV